jgi:hypothetical protein
MAERAASIAGPSGLPLIRASSWGGGAGVGLGEPGKLVVVVVLEHGRVLDQALALGDGLSIEDVALSRDVRVDAIAGVVEMGVESRAEHEPRVLVG